jgi:hypothetical protein
MQFLKRAELEAVAAAMHRMSQKRLPIALAGTGLPQLPGLVVEAKSYAERLFAYPRLDRLGPDAAREALERPAQEENVACEPDALDRILELSGGYPAFLQAYGREVWNTAPKSPIAIDDVRAAEPLVQKKLDQQFFHVRFEKATPTERRYMSAMAALGDGPHQSRRPEITSDTLRTEPPWNHEDVVACEAASRWRLRSETWPTPSASQPA